MAKAVVTVIGKDQPGIIAEVSSTLATHQVNILDLSQTIMSNIFTMSMLVNLEALDESFNVLQDDLMALGQKLNIDIHVQREEIFNAMSRV